MQESPELKLARQTDGHDGAVAIGRVGYDGPDPRDMTVTLLVDRSVPFGVSREQFVAIDDAIELARYLGRIVRGPFFDPPGSPVAAGALSTEARFEVQLVGEIDGAGNVVPARCRPRPGSPVVVHDAQAIVSFLRLGGDLLPGRLSGQRELVVRLPVHSKAFLPRNVGVFGTVGSGKSNTSQVLIEEAAAAGWAVVVVDVEGEYVDVGKPSDHRAADGMPSGLYERPAKGVSNVQIRIPVGGVAPRGAKRFCVPPPTIPDFLLEDILDLTEAQARILRAALRSARGARGKGTDYTLAGLLAALDEQREESDHRQRVTFEVIRQKIAFLESTQLLEESGSTRRLDPDELADAGRMTVLDVSELDDLSRNVCLGPVVAMLFDLICRVDRGEKLANGRERPPILLLIEEVQTFFNASEGRTREAVTAFVGRVARRARKRWMSLALVSQQPALLPRQIFELLNTRFIHQTRSEANLSVLRRSCSDIESGLWDQVPSLLPGRCILSSPVLSAAQIVSVRPASSPRRLAG